MINLPKWMYINGTVYYYDECQGDGEFSDWYFCGLYPKKNREGLPPSVKVIGGSYLFLCSAGFNIEEARKDLLERINSMVYEI